MARPGACAVRDEETTTRWPVCNARARYHRLAAGRIFDDSLHDTRTVGGVGITNVFIDDDLEIPLLVIVAVVVEAEAASRRGIGHGKERGLTGRHVYVRVLAVHVASSGGKACILRYRKADCAAERFGHGSLGRKAVSVVVAIERLAVAALTVVVSGTRFAERANWRDAQSRLTQVSTAGNERAVRIGLAGDTPACRSVATRVVRVTAAIGVPPRADALATIVVLAVAVGIIHGVASILWSGSDAPLHCCEKKLDELFGPAWHC